MPANCPRVLFVTRDEEAFFTRLQGSTSIALGVVPGKIKPRLSYLIEAQCLEQVGADNEYRWNPLTDCTLHSIHVRKTYDIDPVKLDYIRWLQQNFSANPGLDRYGIRYRLQKYGQLYAEERNIPVFKFQPGAWIYSQKVGTSGCKGSATFLVDDDGVSFRLAVRGFEAFDLGDLPALPLDPPVTEVCRSPVTTAPKTKPPPAPKRSLPPPQPERAPVALDIEVVKTAILGLEAVLPELQARIDELDQQIAACDKRLSTERSRRHKREKKQLTFTAENIQASLEDLKQTP